MSKQEIKKRRKGDGSVNSEKVIDPDGGIKR